MGYSDQKGFDWAAARKFVLIFVGLVLTLKLILIACVALYYFSSAASRVPRITSNSNPLGTDPRHRANWVFVESPEGASGSLQYHDTSQWRETRSDGVTRHFDEIGRNNDYVELFDASRALYVRLYADHIEWGRDPKSMSRGQNGSWQPPPVKS